MYVDIQCATIFWKSGTPVCSTQRVLPRHPNNLSVMSHENNYGWASMREKTEDHRERSAQYDARCPDRLTKTYLVNFRVAISSFNSAASGLVPLWPLLSNSISVKLI